MRRSAKVLLVLFLLGLVGGWMVLGRLDGLLRRTLLEAASRAIGERYVVSIGSVRSEPFRGSISLHEVSLLPRPGQDTPGAGFELSVQAERVSLEGLSYWALLAHRELDVEAVRVIAPEVDYIYAPPHRSEDPAGTDQAAPQSIPPTGKGRIGEIELRDGSGSMRRSDRDSADLSIADLDIVLHGLRRGGSVGGGPAWQVTSADAALHGVRGALPPLYDARIDTIALAYPACAAVLSGARITPRADRDNYGKLVDESVELLDVDLPRLSVQGVDIDALLRTRAIHVQRVEATGGHLLLDHDGRLPAKPDRPRSLPRSGLAAMAVDVRVDSLDIALDGFRYGERGAHAKGYGDITVVRPHLRVSDLRTQADPNDPDTLVIHITGDLYGQGAVGARYTGAYGAVDDAFHLAVDLGPMELSRFSALTEEMLNASPVEGRIRMLAMTLDGNSTRATGSCAMAYEGLRLEVLRQEGFKGRLLTGVANMAVIGANPQGDGPMRTVDLLIPRRKDRTIASCIVGGLKEGVIRTILPDRIAKAALEKTR